MALNGSGTFNLPAGNPVVSGTTISSTVHNNTMTEIATALSTAVFKDGQQTLTGNIPFNSQRLTGLGDATAVTDAAKVSQVQNASYTKLSSIAGTDTITATTSPAFTAYADGQTFILIPANTNTGAATLNINSVGAVNIENNGNALVGGELRQGVPTLLRYDGTDFEMVGMPNAFSAAGDLPVGSAAGAFGLLGIGSDNQVLIADSGETLGMKWADDDPDMGSPVIDVTAGAELVINRANRYATGFGATTLTLPELSTLSDGDRVRLSVVGGPVVKVQITTHANDSSTLVWIGTTQGDYIEFSVRGGAWTILEHSESIYLRVSVNADESIAQGASEQITNLTADVDTAGLWDGPNDEVDIPLDALLDLHWQVIWPLANTDAIGAEAKLNTTYLRDFSAAVTAGGSATGGFTESTLSMVDIEASSGDTLELWCRVLDNDSGAVSILGDAAGDESQATIRLRWRY